LTEDWKQLKQKRLDLLTKLIANETFSVSSLTLFSAKSKCSTSNEWDEKIKRELDAVAENAEADWERSKWILWSIERDLNMMK